MRSALCLLFLAAGCSRTERPMAVRDLAQKDAEIRYDDRGGVVLEITLATSLERRCPILRSASVTLNGEPPRDLRPGGNAGASCASFLATFERHGSGPDARFVIDDASGKAVVVAPLFLVKRPSTTTARVSVE
jgi:hypothetical protein